MMRFATPCDGKVECIDGRDEQDCESPIWLLPAVLVGAIFFLLCSQFCYFYKYVMKGVKEIIKNASSTCQQPFHRDWPRLCNTTPLLYSQHG